MDFPGFLANLFNISATQAPQQFREQRGAVTGVENVQNAARSINSGIADRQTDFANATASLNDAITAGGEVTQTATIATTAFVAPAADATSTVLTLIAPFTGPVAPEVFAAATMAEGVAFGAKILNMLAGGNDFTLLDVGGDALNLATAGKGKVGIDLAEKAFKGELIDQALDATDKILRDNLQEEK